MKRLKNLGTRLNKNGHTTSYAEFYCSFCKQIVERPLSYKDCKSCGCMKSQFVSGENNYMYGKKCPEEVRQKIKENHADFSGENNPMFGKKQTEEARQKMRESHTGMITPKAVRIKQSESKIGENNPMYGKSGELAPNWQNGKSFELYSLEFNKQKKQFIKDRDMNICQTPGCMNTENLHVHHIDYNKKNNNPENLTTLCNSCHSKTNFNRQYWTNYYSEIMGIYL